MTAQRCPPGQDLPSYMGRARLEQCQALIRPAGTDHPGWGSCPPDPKSQTKSQRPQTPGHARPLPATITAARWHVRPSPAPSSHATDFAYKRDAGGSNPPAPTRFLQLDGFLRGCRVVSQRGYGRCSANSRGPDPRRLVAVLVGQVHGQVHVGGLKVHAGLVRRWLGAGGGLVGSRTAGVHAGEASWVTCTRWGWRRTRRTTRR